MKESTLQKLIDSTFQKVANPLKGNGMYAEIQKAVMEAYLIGKQRKRALRDQLTEESFSAVLSE